MKCPNCNEKTVLVNYQAERLEWLPANGCDRCEKIYDDDGNPIQVDNFYRCAA